MQGGNYGRQLRRAVGRLHGEKKGSLDTKQSKTKEVVKKGRLEKEPGDGGGVKCKEVLTVQSSLQNERTEVNLRKDGIDESMASREQQRREHGGRSGQTNSLHPLR